MYEFMCTYIVFISYIMLAENIRKIDRVNVSEGYCRRYYMRFIYILVLGILIVAGCKDGDNPVTAQAKEAQVRKSGQRPLLIVTEDFPPYEYLKDGQSSGIDIDIIDVIMNRLGIEYKVEIYPWARTWKMCEQGKADAVMALSYKSKREPYLFYSSSQQAFVETATIPSDTLWMTEYVMFANKKHADLFQNINFEQMYAKKLIIGVIRKHTYFPQFWQKNLKVREYADVPQGFNGLLSGECDLFINDKTVGNWSIAQMKINDNVVCVTDILFQKPYHIVAVKDSDYEGLEKIIKDFYIELDKMRKSGEHQKIYNRYIK